MFKQTVRVSEHKAQVEKQTELKTLSIRSNVRVGVQPECDNCYNYCRDNGYSHRDCRYKVCQDYCSSWEHP